MIRSHPPVTPGSVITARTVDQITGPPVAVPDPTRLVHLQFRRFAGCPVCHLHLRSVVRRHDEIAAAGVREVVVFHAPAGELREHTTGLPFAVIADPTRRLYTEFGVGSGRHALLHPRAWLPVARAVLRSAWTVARGQAPAPAVNPHGGRLGLPADFLIATNGVVVACRYGAHAYDQWSVDELLTLAARAPAAAPARRADRPG